ncbi:hypothetical protein FRB94_004168 [Tulasnella sp. JGI-2019a]|nr:hypothetical protein FRB94_004168 [Tulasnella sp. JGI-2019a]KAG9037285.1 hypothetical protein FRB95_006228 [Tulasnella sp. JGI-2019a]
MFPSAILFAAALGFVKAHTIFQRAHVNGVDEGYLNGIRYPTYDGPITNVSDPSVICNGGPNPLVTPYSQTIITVPAGGTFTAEWHHVLQPDGYNSADVADPIDPGHLGPVLAYMAAVPSALQTDVTGLKWFKIWEDGFDGTNWGVTRLYNAKGLQNFTIPSCIPPGNYFVRAEIIALHAASSYPGAQLYMECAQINVTGGGSASPATVSFPGAYAGTDPGITIDIYYPPVTSYTIPGPPVFTCGTSATTASATTTKATSTTSTTTSKATTTTTTTTKAATTTSTSTTTSTTATPVAEYGQCGGTGYTGSTVCASPYTCTYSSAYYSQCL